MCLHVHCIIYTILSKLMYISGSLTIEKSLRNAVSPGYSDRLTMQD